MGLGNAPAQGTIALIVFTALIGALIGVFGKRAAETLLELLLKPFKWIWELIYRWIAPRNPFSLSLRSYKKHIARSWLTKIENPIGPEMDVPLEHAFAPLKLISSSTQETIDLLTHIAGSYRCIVLGGPGTGKTTLMKSLITRIINGHANEALNSVIPVFVVLRKLAAKQQSVREAVITAFADFHFPGADKFVDSALSQGRMLIILDGLDEVGVNREYVSGQIISFCERDDQQAEKNRVVVTCREYSYRSDDLRSVIKNIVRVEPFANHHMRVFLQGWPIYKGRSALRLYGLIQSDAQIRDICRNPLLLTILTGLYLETNDFEFPTSRNLFYQAAVEELITKRQARRETKQKFEENDKWQVLQRVSLSRLETVQIDEDPEELTNEAIRAQVAKVFRKEIDFNELIKELVEVNGIIKPSSEGIYTCAHRTIQEYFAASEAGRIRTPKEVVYRFSNRQDLIEVLYFYCGMLSNLPQLAEIVHTFVSEGRWLEAGRCLMNMKEAPSGSYVETITGELEKQIVIGSEFKPALEILSSLAQRPGQEFETARKRFSESIDVLAGGDEAVGASALESALATSPEAAMKVIPGLLKHESRRWQGAAVQLLKDIGTDEALDQLVQLLAHENSFIKAQAGQALAVLIKTRGRDLKDRAGLLPEREDKNIWPLEKVFPSKLAIPIAESLVDSSDVGNEAVNCAVKAIHAIKAAHQRDESQFLRVWRNVSRDLTLSKYKTIAGKIMVAIGVCVPLLTVFVILALGLWSYMKDKIVVLEIKPMYMHLLDKGVIRNVEARAKALVSETEQRYPPNASGLSRILPWNWSVEPVIPGSNVAAYKILNDCADYGLSDPYEFSNSSSELGDISVLASKEKVADFEDAVGSLRQNLTDLHTEKYLICPSDASIFVIIVTFGSLAVMSMFWKRTFVKRKLAARKYGFGGLFFTRNLFLWMTTFLVLEFFLVFPKGSVSIRLVSVFGVAIWVGVGLSIQKLRWPRNPLLAVVADVLPPRDSNGDDDLVSSEENQENPSK